MKKPVQKANNLKTNKKSTTKPAAGVVIREAHVETKSNSKEKEKVDVTHGKGMELLSEVALTKEAQMKEVRKKSLKDFHKTHPSGSGTVSKKPPSVEKITPTVINEGTGDKLGVPNMIKDDSTENDDNLESKSDDVNKSNEESDDVNKSDKETNDVIKGDKEIVQDAHVTISTITKKTEVPITSSSRSSDLASKFLNFSDMPHSDAEVVSPLDVHVHYEVLRTQAPTLLTIPISVIIESSLVYTKIPQSSQTVTPLPIVTTPNPPPIIETTNPLSTLLDFASVF
ncbi:hypothetical protein Tco_1227885 [Tanacetum coccineum]